MDILGRISQMIEQRGWTINRLAKESGVSQSTLSGLYRRNNCPTLPTLEKICSALDMTMSEFFSEDGQLVQLSDEKRHLLNRWDGLSQGHRKAILDLISKL